MNVCHARHHDGHAWICEFSKGSKVEPRNIWDTGRSVMNGTIPHKGILKTGGREGVFSIHLQIKEHRGSLFEGLNFWLRWWDRRVEDHPPPPLLSSHSFSLPVRSLKTKYFGMMISWGCDCHRGLPEWRDGWRERGGESGETQRHRFHTHSTERAL